jgi:hypothetical protein
LDHHERGWEIKQERPDMPLPQWRGQYGGDPRRLPRVVQKLLHGHRLTAEEKAELLWRFYELDQQARTRRRKRMGLVAVVSVALVAAAAWVYLHPPRWLIESVADLVQQVHT